eukprot:3937064-Rhodomonas_salina.3
MPTCGPTRRHATQPGQPSTTARRDLKEGWRKEEGTAPGSATPGARGCSRSCRTESTARHPAAQSSTSARIKGDVT